MTESKDANVRTVLQTEINTEDLLDHFVDQIEAHRIDTRLLERFQRLTGQEPHRYLRRGIVFCHRDLDAILDEYERGLPFYLSTRRDPSSESLHIGHSIPFEFARWLQVVLQAPLVIMLTDDMKLLHSKTLTVYDVRRFSMDNAKDILAFGFDPKKTFLFSNLDFVGGALYENNIGVARYISMKSIRATLGFGDDDNVGMFYCCSTQSAGAHSPHPSPGSWAPAQRNCNPCPA
ncbi:MAG: hypothetical protein L6R41_001650 [Letrouitia leprolyta]|nr:MAG: hypothetical protein L6R41_001650 [Letrouitia leprolyta]